MGREVLEEALTVAFAYGNVLAVVGYNAVAFYPVDMVGVYYIGTVYLPEVAGKALQNRRE